MVFQLEVCYKVDRLLTSLTAQQKGTTTRWYSNKTPRKWEQGRKYQPLVSSCVLCESSYLHWVPFDLIAYHDTKEDLQYI